MWKRAKTLITLSLSCPELSKMDREMSHVLSLELAFYIYEQTNKQDLSAPLRPLLPVFDMSHRLCLNPQGVKFSLL